MAKFRGAHPDIAYEWDREKRQFVMLCRRCRRFRRTLPAEAHRDPATRARWDRDNRFSINAHLRKAHA